MMQESPSKSEEKSPWLSKSELFLSISQNSVDNIQTAKISKQNKVYFLCKLAGLKNAQAGLLKAKSINKQVFTCIPVDILNLLESPGKTRLLTEYHDSGHVQVLRVESGKSNECPKWFTMR